jgi:hypothetical protein
VSTLQLYFLGTLDIRHDDQPLSSPAALSPSLCWPTWSSIATGPSPGIGWPVSSGAIRERIGLGELSHLRADVVAGGGVPPAHPTQPIVRAFEL